MDSGEDSALGTALKKSDKSNITDSSPQKRRSEGSEVLSDGKRSRRLEETSHTVPVEDVKQEEPDDVEPVSDEPKDSEEPTDSGRMRSEGSNTPEKDSAAQERVSKPYSEHDKVPIAQSLFGNEPQSSTLVQNPETSHTVPVEDPEQEKPDEPEADESFQAPFLRGSNDPKKCSAKAQERLSKLDDTGTSEGSQPSASAQGANLPAEDSEAGASKVFGMKEYEENRKKLRKDMEDFMNDFDLFDYNFVQMLVTLINEKRKGVDMPEDHSEKQKTVWTSNLAKDLLKIKKHKDMRELRREGRSYIVGSSKEDRELTNNERNKFHEQNKIYVREEMKIFLTYPRHRGFENRIFMYHLAIMFESEKNRVPIWRRMEVSDDEGEDEEEDEDEEESGEDEDEEDSDESEPSLTRQHASGSLAPAPPSASQSTSGAVASVPLSTKGSTPGSIAPAPQATGRPPSGSRTSVPSSTRRSTSGAVAPTLPSTKGPVSSSSSSSSSDDDYEPPPGTRLTAGPRTSASRPARQAASEAVASVPSSARGSTPRSLASASPSASRLSLERDTVASLAKRSTPVTSAPRSTGQPASGRHNPGPSSTGRSTQGSLTPGRFAPSPQSTGRSTPGRAPPEPQPTRQSVSGSRTSVSSSTRRSTSGAVSSQSPQIKRSRRSVYDEEPATAWNQPSTSGIDYKQTERSPTDSRTSQPSTSGATFKAPFPKRSNFPGPIRKSPSGLKLTPEYIAHVRASLRESSTPEPDAPGRRPRTVFTDYQKARLDAAIESGKDAPAYRSKLAKDLGLSLRIVTRYFGNRRRSCPSEIRRRSGTLQAAVKSKKKKKAEEGESGVDEDEEAFDDSGPSTSTARWPRRSAPVVSLSLPSRKKTDFTPHQYARLNAEYIMSNNPENDVIARLVEELDLDWEVVRRFFDNRRNREKKEKQEREKEKLREEKKRRRSGLD